LDNLIKDALRFGFAAVGFSRPKRPLFIEHFHSWIDAGKNGEMKWIERNKDLRENPESLLDGCKTVVSLAYPYSPGIPCTPDGYRTARYSEPDKIDYHNRLRKLGKSLVKSLGEAYQGSRSRVCVDSAPIIERSFAYEAGIGFIGKNNMCILPGKGSYFFLVEVLTTVDMDFEEKRPLQNQCGACTRCMDACPTGALERPFSVDASKCLSYLTIEYQGEVTDEQAALMGDCFFGCDICQEVCPFNSVKQERKVCLPSTEKILEMDLKAFSGKFGKTALARPGLEKIKSNIAKVRKSKPTAS